MPSCEASTRLMSEARERPLSRGERLALRWHLMMCGACRRFERQLDWLHRAAGRYVPPPADGSSPADSRGRPAGN